MKKNTLLAIAAIVIVTVATITGVALLRAQAPEDDHAGHTQARSADRHDDHDGKDGHEEEDGHDAHAEAIKLDDKQLAQADIGIATAGPRRMTESLRLPGEVRFNEDRTAHVVPQVAGTVERVSAQLGQVVKKGQVLAVINSAAVSQQRAELLNARHRLSLAEAAFQREKQLWEQQISAEQDYLQARAELRQAQVEADNARQKLRAIGVAAEDDPARGNALGRYQIRAPFDATVVEKHLGLGEAVREDANAFVLSDLSTVWAEIVVAPKDLAILSAGKPVTVRAAAFEAAAGGRIAHVGALVGEQSRTAKAYVALANPDGRWRPGLFVNVDVGTSQVDVPVAVHADAIQVLEQKNVVFVRNADGFVPREVRLGRRDGDFVEIVDGVAAGQDYAARGSFVLKAELGKGTAEHAH